MSVATEGLGQVSYTVIPPSTLGHLDDNPGAYEYNIEKAKELLAEGGYENGFETTIVVFSDTGREKRKSRKNFLDFLKKNYRFYAKITVKCLWRTDRMV